MEKNKERTENTEGMIRFSISVPPEMNSELDKLKRDVYFKEPYSKMVRDLIRLGLESVKEEGKTVRLIFPYDHIVQLQAI